MSDFFRKHGLILSEVLWYMERSKNLEKNSSPWEDLTVKTRIFRYWEMGYSIFYPYRGMDVKFQAL